MIIISGSPTFRGRARRRGFLEWAEVFGCLYGTLKQEVEPYRELGRA